MKIALQNVFILSLLITTGCIDSRGTRNKKAAIDKNYNLSTEIYCPNSGYRILLLATTKQEVQEAIMGALQDQMTSETYNKTKYTVLYLPGSRSTSVYNTTAKELLNECQIIEFYRKPEGE